MTKPTPPLLTTPDLTALYGSPDPDPLALQRAANLGDLQSVSVAQANLGLGSAALQPASAFDAAGTAASLVSAETSRAQAAEALLLSQSQLGVPSGIATLDRSGSLTLGQLPTSVVRTGSAFSATILGGSGNNNQWTGASTSGQLMHLLSGSAATPDVSLNPLQKISRTVAFASTTGIVGDGDEQASAAQDICLGLATNLVQTVGRVMVAENFGTTVTGGGISPDAAGSIAIGRILGSGAGVGMGLFVRGESQSSAGSLSAVQIQAYNARGTNDSATDTGLPASSAVWIWADGTNRSAQAITIGNPFGKQFDAGIVLNGDVNGAQTGGIASTGIRIAGVMSKAAISIAQGSGPVVLGAATSAFSTAQLDVVNNATADPLAVVHSSATADVSLSVRNATGASRYFASGGRDHILTGTVAGDSGICVSTSSNSFHIGGSSSVIKVTNGNLIAFFNATAVARPAAYTLNAGTTSRNLPSGATTAQIEAFVRQMAADLSASNGGNGLVA